MNDNIRELGQIIYELRKKKCLSREGLDEAEKVSGRFYKQSDLQGTVSLFRLGEADADSAERRQGGTDDQCALRRDPAPAGGYSRTSEGV